MVQQNAAKLHKVATGPSTVHLRWQGVPYVLSYFHVTQRDPTIKPQTLQSATNAAKLPVRVGTVDPSTDGVAIAGVLNLETSALLARYLPESLSVPFSRLGQPSFHCFRIDLAQMPHANAARASLARV